MTSSRRVSVSAGHFPQVHRSMPRNPYREPANEPPTAEQTATPVWCLVANVLIARPSGPGGAALRHGTKHFAPGAKVFVIAAFWGMGAESVSVVGRHRKTRRYFTINMKWKTPHHWRTELVYSPTVMKQIRSGAPSGASLTSGSERDPLDAIAASFARNRTTQPFTSRPRQD